MRNRFLIPLALSLALAAGTAHAQVVRSGYLNGFPVYTLAPPPIPPGFFRAPPLTFAPNPAVRIFPDNFSAYYGGNPGFGTIVPGYGYVPGGFFYYNYNYPAAYSGGGAPPVNPGVAGMAPGYQPAAIPPVNNGPSASSRTPRERRALRTAARRERDMEARVAREYRSLARARALAPGTLLSVRDNIARVRYQTNDTHKIGRFSTRNVYFTTYDRADGKTHVETLATLPGMRHEGDPVTVAIPKPVTVTRRRRSIVISNR